MSTGPARAIRVLVMLRRSACFCVRLCEALPVLSPDTLTTTMANPVGSPSQYVQETCYSRLQGQDRTPGERMLPSSIQVAKFSAICRDIMHGNTAGDAVKNCMRIWMTLVISGLCTPSLISLLSADQDFQSKELPNSRIQPDRRWFGNTRVIGQKQLETFREEMSSKVGTRLRGSY